MDVSEINPDCPTCQLLLKIIRQQEEQIDRLTLRLEQVERESKRQAVSFRKRRKAEPNSPVARAARIAAGITAGRSPNKSTKPMTSRCRRDVLIAAKTY